MAHTNSKMPNYIIHGLVHKHQAVKMQWGGWGVGVGVGGFELGTHLAIAGQQHDIMLHAVLQKQN